MRLQASLRLIPEDPDQSVARGISLCARRYNFQYPLANKRLKQSRGLRMTHAQLLTRLAATKKKNAIICTI
jgi:hypothetical protein